jgi:hypothetical protein
LRLDLKDTSNIHTLKHNDRDYNIVFSEDIEEVKSEWPHMSGCPNILLSYEYLATIHHAPPEDMDFLYGILSRDGDTIGYYYFQYRQFNARKNINYNHAHNFGQKAANFIKRTASWCINARGLVFGNLLVTGNHGLIFLDDEMGEKERWQLHDEVLKLALDFSRRQGKNLKFVLGKDYEMEAEVQSHVKWNSVKVQPNMILNLDPSWNSMDTYLDAMTSKYRKRINSALRKMDHCKFVEVDAEAVEKNIEWIYALYLEIVDRAPFNMFILSKDYFINIKRNLGDACDFSFVYEDDKLIAFQINLSNGEHYEAHFLGYDHSCLKSHDIYLNLLLNSVRLAIAKQKSSIVFSRTAMQIKSSIGAVPEDLYLYLAINNKILNRFAKAAVNRLNPPVIFDQRHPFK